MKSILFKKLSYNVTRIAFSVLASTAVMTVVAYAASTIGTNFSADGTLSVTATSTLSSDLRVDTNTLVVDSFNDRVGIGTTSPYAKLSVAGEVVGSYFTATTTTATSTFNGDINFGITSNLLQGGQRFLTSSTTGAGNLTIGYQSATNIESYGGVRNTGLGYQSLGNATSTSYNTAVGYQALLGSATISNTGYNTAIGYKTLYLNTTGANNVALGYMSASANTTGISNTAIGMQSLYSNTAGSNNVAIGLNSLFSNTTGNQNTADGRNSLFYNTTGSYNTTNGYQAGYGDGTTADQRSVIDNYMTFIGFQASRDSTIASTTALSNGTAIGKNAKVGASNSIVLGGTGSDAVNVGIGTSTPQKRLAISSGSSATTTIQIGDVYSGTGKTCFEASTNTGSIVSFYFAGTTMVVEANACR